MEIKACLRLKWNISNLKAFILHFPAMSYNIYKPGTCNDAHKNDMIKKINAWS